MDPSESDMSEGSKMPKNQKQKLYECYRFLFIFVLFIVLKLFIVLQGIDVNFILLQGD